jgi:hypothetical protein
MANEFMSGAEGGLGGAGIGASIGTALLPGVGTIIGAALGAGIGAAGGVGKAKKSNNALAQLMAVPNVDPNQIAFKDQLAREKRMVDSGMTTDFQVARDIIGESEAGGLSVAAEMAKSNPALALMMMNQTEAGAAGGINKALGTISTRSMGYTQMMGEMVDKISARDIQMSLLKAQTNLGIATKEQSDFNANMMGGMAQLGSPAVASGLQKGIGKIGSLFASSGGAPSVNSLMTGLSTDPSILAKL